MRAKLDILNVFDLKIKSVCSLFILLKKEGRTGPLLIDTGLQLSTISTVQVESS